MAVSSAMAKLIKRSSDSSSDGSHAAPADETVIDTKRLPVIDRDIFEARTQAQQILDKARAQAEELLQQSEQQATAFMEQTRQEAEQLKAAARESGYAEGKSQGAAELAEFVAHASQRLDAVEAQLVPQIKELAVRIARKILGKELETHPEAVVNIVKQALAEKARTRREIFLRVHPDDFAVIRESKPQLLDILSRCKEIGIREDPTVGRYGVIIETDAGNIDAQLDTQLEIFERVLQNLG